MITKDKFFKIRRQKINLITIAICEDDVIYLKEIEKMIRDAERELGENIRIKEYTDGDGLMAAMNGMKKIDIVFLDIGLGEENGIEIARELKVRFPGLVLIYISSYKDYVYDALKTEPMDFLIKPVNETEMRECLIRAVRKVCNLDFIRVKDENGYYHVRIDEILYISSGRKHLYITVVGNKEYRVIAKLNDFEKIFEKHEVFIRIHKSHLVNFNHVRRYENKRVIMSNGQELSISRERRNEVREKYMALNIKGL